MTPRNTLLQGDALAVLAGLPAGCVDAVVTDPPYGLHFMGQQWDGFGSGTGRRALDSSARPGSMSAGAYDSRRNAEYGRFMQALGRELWRVLKPGGRLLMFGAPRRFHWQGVALELAGFEITDGLCWLFGEGFPKSHNLHGSWEGWGTALKPGWEPILLARKPLERGLTVASNVNRHGTGALNVAGCGLPVAADDENQCGPSNVHYRVRSEISYGSRIGGRPGPNLGKRRWPPNVALDDTAAAFLDEQAGERKGATSNSANGNGSFDWGNHGLQPGPADTGGASRFFYVAKARREEREAGLAGMRNDHPTVKPIELMRWLVRLVTPPGGIVLDPLAGTGTTLCAAALEGFDAVGIEQSAHYCDIARARWAYWREVAAEQGNEAVVRQRRAGQVALGLVE